jgi:hypothetical protein
MIWVLAGLAALVAFLVLGRPRAWRRSRLRSAVRGAGVSHRVMAPLGGASCSVNGCDPAEPLFHTDSDWERANQRLTCEAIATVL